MTLDTTVRTSGMDCAGQPGAVEAVGSEGEADLTAKAERRCEVEGCARKHCAHGLCKRHYMQAYNRSNYRPSPRHPYAASLADEMDEAVVERLIEGDHSVSYTSFERREAVRLLRCRGRSYPQIAATTGITERQVHRDLKRLGLIGAVTP